MKKTLATIIVTATISTSALAEREVSPYIMSATEYYLSEQNIAEISRVTGDPCFLYERPRVVRVNGNNLFNRFHREAIFCSAMYDPATNTEYQFPYPDSERKREDEIHEKAHWWLTQRYGIRQGNAQEILTWRLLQEGFAHNITNVVLQREEHSPFRGIYQNIFIFSSSDTSLNSMPSELFYGLGEDIAFSAIKKYGSIIGAADVLFSRGVRTIQDINRVMRE